MMDTHKKHIQECFDLALKAYGHTSPNPLVGCIITKDDNVIAKGFHKGSGQDHAEVDAIKNATSSLEGSTLYCNLEPCCHTNKKTPPCAQFIITTGIKKVVISNLDPNPQVAGKGVKILRDAGVEVITGVLEEKGKKLNEVFFYHIVHNRPFVEIKWAQTLDGKLATLKGDSKWITNDQSRQNVHYKRMGYDAILVGSQTIKNDNPILTARYNNHTKALKRIILCTSPNDLQADLFHDEYKEHNLIILPLGQKTDLAPYINITHNNQGFDLDILLKKLYERGIMSVFVEGGAKTIGHFIESNHYQKVSIYMAPKILGDGKSISIDSPHAFIKNAPILKNTHVTHFGSDFLIEGRS